MKNDVRMKAGIKVRMRVGYDVDVLVVGGSSGAVAAALEAKRCGARVALLAPRPYLGEDICAHWRLWSEPGGEPGEDRSEPQTALARSLFPAASPDRECPTPMHVKKTLEDSLLNAGVPFLYGTYVSEALLDGRGGLAGVVLANRSGRSVVRAGVLVDATERAVAARLAGAAFSPYPEGIGEFRRVVLGGRPSAGAGKSFRRLSPDLIVYQDAQNMTGQRIFEVTEYRLQLHMRDGSWTSFAHAEQEARALTYQVGQVGSSEWLFQVPPDPMVAKAHVPGPWPGALKVELDAFTSSDVEGLYVLGGCAAVTREAAEALLRPAENMALGERIGANAALLASSRPVGGDASAVRSVGLYSSYAGAVGTNTEFLREQIAPASCRENEDWMDVEEGKLPILGEYDVVVAGGGTGGASAGIAAARQGARTLVCEYQPGLGGVGTLGLIGRYWFGNRVGFTAEIDRNVALLEGGDGAPKEKGWDVEAKMEWYRRELRAAGGELWFMTMACGAYVEEGTVKGLVVATPAGRGVVLAKTVIDCTGNADVAAAAGAATRWVGSEHVALQGTGLPPRMPGSNYTNTDHTFTDDGDARDATHALAVAREKFKDAFDLGQFIDTRERRRIEGDFLMTPLDIYVHRTYPDTINVAISNFDSHGFSVHPIFLLMAPGHETVSVDVPYRCLLPKGLEGILVTGLGISAHRDAMPVIRMQADVQNQGYAAGVAAALAAQAGVTPRAVDLQALQKHLVEVGNLPVRVLSDRDSLPRSIEEVAKAVATLANDLQDSAVAVVLAHAEAALPMLREAYHACQASPSAGGKKAELAYARTLAVLGDATGRDTLKQAVREAAWDKGWNYKGMGQFGASMSALDGLIVCLGKIRDEEGLDILLDKLKGLGWDAGFSHFRAIAEALEWRPDNRAAGPLEILLRDPALRGHAFTDIATAKANTPPDRNDTKARNAALQEIHLARALYRCGDSHGLGRSILEEYSRDLRGLFSGHAHAVL